MTVTVRGRGGAFDVGLCMRNHYLRRWGLEALLREAFYNPSHRERKIRENLAFIFKDATPTQLTEITHLKNTPWERTISEKGRTSACAGTRIV